MKLLEFSIVKVGNIQNLTLSKKSTPGDGTHACGKKGGSRT